MKRAGWVLAGWVVMVAVWLAPAWALAAEHNDSGVFLIDVSETMGYKDYVAQAEKIARSMNQKFPNYVLSAGAEIYGNMNYPQIEWISPVQDYDRAALDQALSGLTKGNGSTPMGSAVNQSGPGLEQARGKKALIVIGDGLDNGFANLATEIKILKDKYQSDLCVYTIQIGDNPRGTKVMADLVKAGGCGKTTKASELQSDEGVQALVDIIFPPEGKVVAAVAAPAPQAKPKVILVEFTDTHFDFDKSTLTPLGKEILVKNIKTLKDNPNVNILIAGYTSASGTDEYNQKLSERRATTVRDALIAGGIAPERLTKIGYGEKRPATFESYPEDLESKAAKSNMRVLFTIIVK